MNDFPFHESRFHEGELEVQARAGVGDVAARVGQSIGREMPLKAQEFLSLQPFVVLGSVAPSGEVWASLLSGAPGFACALDAHTLQLEAQIASGDPLGETLGSQAQTRVGLLAIEPETRRRMRVNGVASQNENGLQIEAREVYANCPKYICKRVWHEELGGVAAPDARIAALRPEHARWIESADTFFIASAHPQRNADASHRGGNPGFVRVLDENTLRFPDYAGNAMFNTLGNLAVNPNAGLLFVDWKTGATLQLSGRARVLWDAPSREEFVGAERAVEFDIAQIAATAGATTLRWDFIEASPFNPRMFQPKENR